MDHTIVLAFQQFTAMAAKETSGLRINYPINARDLDEGKLVAATKEASDKLGRPIESRVTGCYLILSVGAA